MSRAFALVAALLFTLSACASAADPAFFNWNHMPQRSKLTIERLYASPSLSGPSPRGVKFSPDGMRVTFLKPRDDDQGRFDLWQFEVATGKASLLVDSSLVDPTDAQLAEAEKAMREHKRIAGTRGIADYDWGTADTVLVPAGGELHLVTLADGTPQVRQLTHTDAFEYDARVSPKGSYVSFIRDGALYVITLATGEERRISPAAEPEKAISYGVAEFVAQEEMDRYTGYWWSPDEQFVAFTKVDESGVEIVPRFDIAADQVTVVEQRYPRAGRPNAVVDLFVQELANGNTTEVAWRQGDWGAAADQYLARVRWAGDTIYIQAVNRAQTLLRNLRSQSNDWSLVSFDAEPQHNWVNLGADFTVMSDYILTTDERAGYRHIKAWSRDHKTGIQVTAGDWAVNRIEGVSATDNTVFFTGFMDSPLEQHLYKRQITSHWVEACPECANVQRREGPPPTRVTEAGKSWSVTVSPDGQSFVGTSSSPTQPPQAGLYRIDGTLIAWIEENRLDGSHPYAPYLNPDSAPEFGTLTAEDGQTLHYSVQKPKDFDPARKYPVIVEVYGGPHVQTVKREWGPLADGFYADQGYVVFRLDNRGTSNRGKNFEDVIHLQMGQAEVRDQLRGVDWLKSQPFVDADRIAVQGWSYGGYMTLRLILAAPPGTFAAAVAGAPVTDWSLYDTFYTERYMGTPENNAAGYAAGNVFPDLDKLSTPLLLVHGMADDNVTFDNTTRLMAALQELGKPFEVMVYPGQRHGIRGEALQVHLMRTRMSFLERYMKPETN